MKIIDYKNSLVNSYKKNRRTFIFYLILRSLVILILPQAKQDYLTKVIESYRTKKKL